MQILFLDESGSPAERKGLFALGGLVVQDSNWPLLRERWQATLGAHRWPLDREVKWHGIRKGAVPDALADGVFQTLRDAPITCYVTVFDLGKGPSLFPPEEHAFFRSAEDVYATALMFLAERFNHLLRAYDDMGIIVVDSRFRESDQRLRRFFTDLTEQGTPYMRLERIIEGLFLGPSEHSIGLQCADLVVAATLAAERGIGQGRGYFRMIERRFATHPSTGELRGVGLKRFPDDEPSPRRRDRLF